MGPPALVRGARVLTPDVRYLGAWSAMLNTCCGCLSNWLSLVGLFRTSPDEDEEAEFAGGEGDQDDHQAFQEDQGLKHCSEWSLFMFGVMCSVGSGCAPSSNT